MGNKCPSKEDPIENSSSGDEQPKRRSQFGAFDTSIMHLETAGFSNTCSSHLLSPVPPKKRLNTPNTRRKSQKKLANNISEPIEIVSSDDEDAEDCFDLVRITVGSKHSSNECKIRRIDDSSLEASWKFRTVTRSIPFSVNDVTEFKTFCSSENDPLFLVAMKIKPKMSNNLKPMECYDPNCSDKDRRREYVNFQFKNRVDFDGFLGLFRELGNFTDKVMQEAELDVAELDRYSARVLEVITAQKRKPKGGSKKQGNDLLLVFPVPFEHSEERVDAASKGMAEPKTCTDDDSDDEISGRMVQLNVSRTEDQTDNTKNETKKSRVHYLTIRQEDRERLESTEYLNDTLIDFWMQWYVPACYSCLFHSILSNPTSKDDEEGRQANEPCSCVYNAFCFYAT